ncbi:hypothetical protein CEN50_23065 [Fischerella thermalis CCMEE 5268]|uniref:Uncharacterized protein n=1 Tax=Fischerella thermalis CCMEE 5268 TaxID=2019662 RepID=A0A2N6KA81_9CYAN|nr:hypothetical protein [Fischerella thermalis]PLZ95212.1 hypothetical protein CEN50_23065 [Fischerella thermalis CCMEE 5268]
MEPKQSLSEYQMWNTAHNIAKMLVQEQQRIEASKDGIRSQLGKVIAYLRATINQNISDTENFFKYLKTLADSSKSVKQTDRTPDYCRSIHQTCTEYLKNIEANPKDILEILGWTFRLFNYYKVTPLEDFEKLSASNRQLEIQIAAKSQNLKIGDEIEAEITKINGKKVTYQMLKILPKTAKEDKYYHLLEVGEVVIVKIIEIKNGVPSKVKFVRKK